MSSRPRTALHAALDTWCLEAMVASRFLGGLYRAMGDGAQAAAALRAGRPACDRMERLRTQPNLLALLAAFKDQHPDEFLAEEAAWLGLITSLGGTSIFLAMSENSSGAQVRGLRGLQNSNARALATALRGYRAGFPDATVHAGEFKALRDAAEQCAEVFIGDREEDSDLRAALVQECEQTLLAGLRATLSNP